MVVALADKAGLQKVASFTLDNLFQAGDNIHTTYVEDNASSGVQHIKWCLQFLACEPFIFGLYGIL